MALDKLKTIFGGDEEEEFVETPVEEEFYSTTRSWFKNDFVRATCLFRISTNC